MVIDHRTFSMDGRVPCISAEIEATLNLRSLMHLSDYVKDQVIIKAAHFLSINMKNGSSQI